MNRRREDIYGYGGGDLIRLTTVKANFDWEQVEKTLRAYSAYEPAFPKIKAALKDPGWYECFISYEWFRSRCSELTLELEAHGIQLTVEQMSTSCKKPLR